VSVRLSSGFVLFCVGSGFATGLITHPRNLTNAYEDPEFHINSDANRPEGLIRKRGEEEEKSKITICYRLSIMRST
jgi:hypothetical protein